MKVTFDTTTWIEHDGKLVKDLTFSGLFRAISRRLTTVCALYGELGADQEEAFARLDALADEVKTVDANLRPLRWERLSEERGVRHLMCGLMGWAVFEGEVGELLPMLAMAEVAHVGKSTSFGLGRVRVNLASGRAGVELPCRRRGIAGLLAKAEEAVGEAKHLCVDVAREGPGRGKERVPSVPDRLDAPAALALEGSASDSAHAACCGVSRALFEVNLDPLVDQRVGPGRGRVSCCGEVASRHEWRERLEGRQGRPDAVQGGVPHRHPGAHAAGRPPRPGRRVR